MSILAIETATDQLGVALVDETRVLASFELLAERAHAVELPQAVTKVLQAGGQVLEQLEAIAVDIGPGSFTGLRIGLAFAKALVFRIQKPLVGVPSLDILAAHVPYASHQICPILDAKQRKVYTALYQALDGRLRKQSDYQLVTIDELMSLFKDGSVVFLGDGVPLCQAQLQQHLGERALFAPPELWLPKAATLGRLGLERLRQGVRDDPRTLVPMYLYPMDCSVQKPSVAQAPQAGKARSARAS